MALGQVGLMFWAGRDPAETLNEIQALGINTGQLGVPGDLPLDDAAKKSWKKALDDARFKIVTVFAAYTGENYADQPTVQRTVGFIPQYSVVREMIATGKLGPVRSAILRRRCAAPFWSQWLGNKEVSGGGVFDLLIHDIDFCVHCFGYPEAVSAVGYEDLPRGIDWITANLFYPDIGGVVISGGWHHPKSFPFSMEYTVVGECGTVEFHSSGVPPTLYRSDGEKEALALPERDGYQAELEYFVECCRNNRKPEFCAPEESAASVKLGLLLLEARERKGEKIACKI